MSVRLTSLIFILFFSFLAACEKKEGGDDYVLKEPVPEPRRVSPEPPPLNTDEKEDDDGDDKEEPGPPPETAPKFSLPIPRSLSVLENEDLETFSITAVSQGGGTVSYFYQCPYSCPAGINLTIDGKVTWRPTFEHAGEYDIRFIAANELGESAVSHFVRITVLNVNRPPKIDSVTIVPDNVNRPSDPIATIICDVKKTDLDKDDLVVTRRWFVDGEELSSTERSIDAKSVGAGAVLKCSARVVDRFGAQAEPMTSEEFRVPNKAPVVTSVKIINHLNGGQTFKVGDTVSCVATATDEDLDDTHIVKTIIKSIPDEVVYLNQNVDGATLTLSSTQAHKNLACFVEVSDGFDTASATSPGIEVQNSRPTISSISMTLIGAGVLETGRTVQCDITFSDPDKDPISPSVSFANNGIVRSGATVFQSSPTTLSSRYVLKTVYDVSDPAKADVFGGAISCRGVVVDTHDGRHETETLTVAVADTPPTISVVEDSLLKQIIYVDNALVSLDLVARDLDGQTLSFEKESDSCAAKNLLVSVNSSGVVSSGKAPYFLYPHSDLSCVVNIRARSNNVVTSPVKLEITVPNRAPSISCSNKLQYLRTAQENFRRQAIGLGASISASICTVFDPDSNPALNCTGTESSDGNCYRYALENNGCSLALGNGLSVHDEKNTNVQGSMGLDACTTKVFASDGSLETGRESIDLRPIIALSVSNDLKFGPACHVSASVQPTFGAGWAYSALSPASTSVTSVTYESGQGEALSPIASANFSEARLTQADLELNLESLISWGWTMKAVQDSTNVSSRTVSHRYTIKTAPLPDDSVYARRPIIGLGLDATDGRQASPAASCLRRSGCLGIGPTSRPASLAAGDYHTCMLVGTGLVMCWGSDGRGQVGNGTPFESESSPRSVVGINVSGGGADPAVQVSAGGNHSCAVLESGKVVCWGDNGYGQLGNGEVFVQGEPDARLVLSETTGTALTGAVQVASGSHHNCALLANGDIYCWGSNAQRQLGLASDALVTLCSGKPCSSKAVRAPSLPKPAVGIYAGGFVTCALFSDYTASCFGFGGFGQLGGGTYQTSFEPVSSSSGLGIVNSLTLGDEHVCLLTSGGKLHCHGEDASGQLGLGGTSGSASTQQTASLSGVAAVSAGLSHTCALIEGGLVTCFGAGTLGQLGDGTSTTRKLPGLAVALGGSPLSGVVAVSAGLSHTCAETVGKRVYCWGEGTQGQLGNSLFQSSASAVEVAAAGVSALDSCTEIFKLERDL